MGYVFLGLVGLLSPAARLVSWRSMIRRPRASWQARYVSRRYGLSAFPWAVGFGVGAILMAIGHETAGYVTLGIGVLLSGLIICWLPPTWRPTKNDD